MPATKYYDGIAKAQTSAASANEKTVFNLSALASNGLKSKLVTTLFNALLGPTYALSRRFFPVFRAAGFYHVTRDADVRAVLSQPDIFAVPFGIEMAELVAGPSFALGVDGPAQARQNQMVRQALTPTDGAYISELTGEFAKALLQNSHGRIDVVEDLFKRSISEACIRFFGLDVADAGLFADWMIACSMHLFGDPFGDPKVRAQAVEGAKQLRMHYDEAIQRAKLRLRRFPDDRNEAFVDRLVRMQAAASVESPISDGEIRAILFGVMTGFVPTNTLASGKMLDELLRRPAAWTMAVDAAQKGVAGLATLKQILLEAGRFNPAIAPGVWRYCANGAALGGKQIAPGSTLLVSTMSALRDARAIPKPRRFWPDRTNEHGQPVHPDLMFGAGIHECVGKYLAMDQITALFAALLSQSDLKRATGKAGRLQSIGPYPRNLVMTYATPAAQQSMFLIIAPVTTGASKYAVDKDLAALGHPAGAAIRAAMDATGLVHFCSLASILSDDALHIAFELSCDGSIDEAVAAIAEKAGALLRPAFAHAGLAEGDDVQKFLRRHVVELHGKPWSANGLNYNGLPEFPVEQVAKQARFADFAGRVLRDYVATETARGSHPMLAMAHLRRIVRRDPDLLAEATPAQAALMDEARDAGFDAFSLTTQASRLKLARYRPVTNSRAALNFLTSVDGQIVVLPLLALFAVFALAFWPAAKGPLLWKLLALGTKALLSTALVATAIAAMFLFKLRRAEQAEKPDTSQAPIEKLRAIMAQENAPGHAQNHILAVGTMKPGWFRAFTHAFALWGIRNLIVYGFRPGFVINMGTIHYARWWRLPGTNKVCFYSNFDGSWESYLEDFITRARQGQTAAWSNWQGFPRTRFMIGLGAENGDAFKRWVRIQQQVVPFWYARFPDLTSDQIRNNALIHSGASLARTASESEEWMRCFGSMPRTENRIESDEVQAIIFRGMKRLPYSACLAIKLPSTTEALGEWLCWVRGKAMQPGTIAQGQELKALIDEGIIIPVPRPAGRPPEYALAHALTVAFGDRPLTGEIDGEALQTVANPEYDRGGKLRKDAADAASHAVFLAFSAAGVARFEGRSSLDGPLIDAFPYAFRMGMAGRSRVIGDAGEDAPGHWRWGDDVQADNATEAVVMLYAATRAQLDRLVTIHSALLQNHGGGIHSQTDCAPAWDDPAKSDFEHFGYRDGISQPVMRGTSRSMRGVPARDIVEPGEFILGYKNGQGFFPPSPLLPPESDVRGALPVAVDGVALSRYPDFGDASLSAGPRDFGRNGSFLVLRELKQDVAAFEEFVETASAQLTEGGLCDLYKLVGQHPDKDWVKAKLMGRWPNGRPLVGNPVNLASHAGTVAAENENDFSYGEEDAQGLACPFGAHIRRSNPRDSKQPGDESEQVISNRHRLLRRGRTYSRKDTGEKGLLFASLCTDIERQFEFVQQFWSNAPAFHGLDKEPDPITGSDPVRPSDGCPVPRVFTIPTVAGPVQLQGLKKYVQTMGGGYFFLPSRSALGWLTDVALYAVPSSQKEKLK